MNLTFEHERAEVVNVMTVTINAEPLPPAHQPPSIDRLFLRP
jgi:hypothetical protein